MTLRLKLRNPTKPQEQQAPVKMSSNRLSVGRATDSDLVLIDPECLLSKRHCVLERHGQDYVLIDTSTNGTFLNYRPERLDGTPTPLNHGDVILIGAFELVVEIEATLVQPPANDPATMPPVPKASGPHTANHSLPPIPHSLLLDEAGDEGASFLDDLLGDAPPAIDPSAGTAQSPFARAPEDHLHAGPSVSDHSPAAQDHFAAPRATAAVIPDNWEDSLIRPKPADAHTPPATPAATAPKVPPPPKREKTLPPVSAPAQVSAMAAAVSSTPDDALLKAFLGGVGAQHLKISAEDAEATMARMGRVMAAMVAGMREILMARAAIKSEMRVARTMIHAQANNPLKFSISVDQAVEAMIQPATQGYLDPEAAVHEVLSDIKAHEIATMTGMQAALRDLLARLGPEQMSARIGNVSGLGNLLGNKKARYWEAYEKHYAQLAQETENDFQSTFGKEFARAYEDQIKKL